MENTDNNSNLSIVEKPKNQNILTRPIKKWGKNWNIDKSKSIAPFF